MNEPLPVYTNDAAMHNLFLALAGIDPSELVIYPENEVIIEPNELECDRQTIEVDSDEQLDSK